MNTTICITTRNRVDDLGITMTRLADLGFTDTPIVVVDDASDREVIAERWSSRFSRLTVIRNSERKGLIANRNLMARHADTRFVLSLDDDSCFVDRVNLAELERRFVEMPRLIAAQFNNFDVKAGEVPVAVNLEPYQVQCFTGCGHMLDRERFLALGGFNESFFQMCEERDFCQRAFRRGYEVVMFPQVVVEHRRTPVARFPSHNARYLVRNTVYLLFMNTPWWVCLAKCAGIVPYVCAKRGLGVARGALRGLLDGLIFAVSNRSTRHPMPSKLYSMYSRLPQAK